MNTPDQDTLFRAVVDARSILSEHFAFGSRDLAPMFGSATCFWNSSEAQTASWRPQCSTRSRDSIVKIPIERIFSWTLALRN